MKKVEYKTIDGICLNGILEENNFNKDFCVILCHGIKGNKNSDNFIELSQELNKIKIDHFRFDFRGHGENNSDFSDMTITGEILDLQSSIEYIEKLGYKRIILLGASFGGGIISLLNYSKIPSIKGFIFWYPALVYQSSDLFRLNQVREAIKKGYMELPTSQIGKKYRLGKQALLETLTYSPYESLKYNKLSKIFIQGDQDTATPIEDCLRCAKESPNSEMIIIQNGVHNFKGNEQHKRKAISHTIDFIQQIIKK